MNVCVGGGDLDKLLFQLAKLCFDRNSKEL